MPDFDTPQMAALDPKKLSPEEFRALLTPGDSTGAPAIDLSTVEAPIFARLVSRASKEQIKAVVASDLRDHVLGEIFRRMEKHFRPEKAGSTGAVIHWCVGDRPDGGVDTYETVIESGVCATNRPPRREPRVTITLGGAEFLSLVSGNANPVLMFMTGKLKLKGDIGLAANLTNLFDIPKA